MKMKILVIIIVTIIAMPLVGYSANNTTETTNTVVKNEKKPLYWIDTMEPNIHYPAPGKSRMGMDLVPVYPKEKNN